MIIFIMAFINKIKILLNITFIIIIIMAFIIKIKILLNIAFMVIFIMAYIIKNKNFIKYRLYDNFHYGVHY